MVISSMSLKGQFIIIIGMYFIVMLYIRGFLYGIKRYQLSNTSYKKRKKAETFKEWLFYSRYKEEIPKPLRILYYVVLMIHPLCMIACTVMYFMKLPAIGKAIAIDLTVFDILWVLVIQLLFWSPGPDWAYERWITRKRGQKRDKK